MPATITRQIKGEIYNSLRTALTAPNAKKQSWTDQFIQEMLKEAKKNPSGPLGQLISRQLLQDDIISSLDSETEKLLARDMDFLHYRLIKQLYQQQREVAYDKFISRKVIATSRRAGKTNLAARLLIDYCIEPNTPCLYIHTKAENCMTQCWPLIIDAAKEIELNIEKADATSMIITFSNGSSIKLYGNKDKSSAPLLRGGKYKLIIIDEAQDQRNMVELVEDVCEPMLVDYQNSCMILQGTPPRRPKTYFEKCWNSSGWKHYHFTMNDNPFLNDQEDFIKGVAERKNIPLDDPLILREYRGEFVFDTTAQVFSGYRTYDGLNDPLINFPIDHVYIGNDYGWAANNAIIGIATNNRLKKGYVFYESQFNKASVTQIIDKNKECFNKGIDILKKYNQPLSNIGIYGDTSDESIIFEMATVHHLPAYKCYKYDKETAIAQLAEFCSTGMLYIPKGGILEDDFMQTLYERDEDDNITSEINDELYHPDAAMALLYASRQFAFDWGLQTQSENFTKSVSDILEGR